MDTWAQSMLGTGFQATNVALAIDEINRMVGLSNCIELYDIKGSCSLGFVLMSAMVVHIVA